MSKIASQVLSTQHRSLEWARQAVIVVSASLFVALCAQISVLLPFTPVPFTLQNFGVLLVGMMLGGRRGFAALALYLVEGVSGLPVFSPHGPGGIAQLIGPTGGYLLAYPMVAGLAGWIMERGRKSFLRALGAGLLGELALFAGGISWLFVLTHSITQAFRLGVYWFIFFEIIKIMAAAAMVAGWGRADKSQV
jgi:biotin transport system substrate-specific component